MISESTSAFVYDVLCSDGNNDECAGVLRVDVMAKKEWEELSKFGLMCVFENVEC